VARARAHVRAGYGKVFRGVHKGQEVAVKVRRARARSLVCCMPLCRMHPGDTARHLHTALPPPPPARTTAQIITRLDTVRVDKRGVPIEVALTQDMHHLGVARSLAWGIGRPLPQFAHLPGAAMPTCWIIQELCDRHTLVVRGVVARVVGAPARAAGCAGCARRSTRHPPTPSFFTAVHAGRRGQGLVPHEPRPHAGRHAPARGGAHRL
jgi:hypothetical protein